jgi:hypothetical protein
MSEKDFIEKSCRSWRHKEVVRLDLPTAMPGARQPEENALDAEHGIPGMALPAHIASRLRERPYTSCVSLVSDIACGQRRTQTSKDEEMIMKTVIATALIALGLLSTIPAQAAAYNDYPVWAQEAFEPTV